MTHTQPCPTAAPREGSSKCRLSQLQLLILRRLQRHPQIAFLRYDNVSICQCKSTRCFAVAIGTVLLFVVFSLESITSWQGTNRRYMPQPIRANVQMTSNEVHHVIFVKVHKAASTTIMNVFIRFAMSRQLNVMFPRHGNILSNRSPDLSAIADHPESPPFLFDILCNHVIFDVETLRPFFPTDTKHVAILREPWNHVQSAYYYFRDVEGMGYLQNVPCFQDYISDPLRYEPRDSLLSFTMNRMSTDLGLPPQQARNASYAHTFIAHLHRTFHLVLIAERFEESVILLKRHLRWKTKDVLFMKQNEHVHFTLKKELLHPSEKKRFERLNHHDVAIYDHFSHVFQTKVDAEGPSFAEEVKSFTAILKTVRAFCSSEAQCGTLVVNSSLWNEVFEVSREDCQLMLMGEIVLVDKARESQAAHLMLLYPELKRDSLIMAAVFTGILVCLVLLAMLLSVYSCHTTQRRLRI